MYILQVNNIRKEYDSVVAVDNVSFQVAPGKIYGIIGPNGAGKTTTIRMVMNILQPDSGEITLFGEKMSAELQDKIGYLPEERGLYANMKVGDILLFLGKLHGMKRENAVQAGNDWLNRLELADWGTKKVEELSKGMQQKIQFIGTIMHDPDLIILDEPFSGLDPINTQVIKDIMLELRRRNKAIIFSTHLMEAAEKLCDDILLINKGQVVLEGPLGQIRKNHGRNAVQIEYEGNGDFIKSLPMVDKTDDYGQYTEVIIKDNGSANQLLKQLVDKIEIRRFQATESSLNDIFIDKVGRSENE